MERCLLPVAARSGVTTHGLRLSETGKQRACPVETTCDDLRIRDVARTVGVSAQTVSRVINNHPDVAPDTLARVQQAIKDLGYAPDVLARSLISGHSRTIEIVAYGLEFYGPSRLLTGIEHQAAELGYSTALNLVHRPELAGVKRLLNMLKARRVDGVIWAIPEIGSNRKLAREISLDASLPMVFVNGDPTAVGATLIGIDNVAIGHRHAAPRGRWCTQGRHRHRSGGLVGGAAARRRVEAGAWRLRVVCRDP